MADDWFQQNAPQSQGSDWFKQNAPITPVKTAAPHGVGKTGVRLKSPAGERDPSLLDWFPHMAEHLESPSLDTTAGVASDTLRYLGMAASPTAVGPILAHPGAAAAAFGVGVPMQAGVQLGGELTGNPGIGALAGDVAGVGSGWAANKLLNLLPTGAIQSLWESPSLRSQVARKIPGLKTALEIKDILTPEVAPTETGPTMPGGPSPYNLKGKLPKFTPASKPKSYATPAGPRTGLEMEGSLVPSVEPPVMPGGPSPYNLSGKLPKFTQTPRTSGMPSGVGGGGRGGIQPVYPPMKSPPNNPGGSVGNAPEDIAPVAAPNARLQSGIEAIQSQAKGVDKQIATYLKSKNIKPEDVMKMDENTLYSHGKSAVPSLRRFGTAGKLSRPFAERQQDIFDALSTEWGR